MEKKKKNKPLIKVLSILALIVVLTCTLVTSVGATDVYFGGSPPDEALLPSLPLSYIMHEDIVGITGASGSIINAVCESPFIFYDYKELNSQFAVSGKNGVILNIPYQDGSFTNSGRTLFYSYDLYTNQFGVCCTAESPITFSDGDVHKNNQFNATMSTLFFDDFVIELDGDDFFYVGFADNGNGGNSYPTIEVEFDVLELNGNSTDYFLTNYSTTLNDINDVFLDFAFFDDIIASYGGSVGDDFSYHIQNLRVKLIPFNTPTGPIFPDENRDVSKTYFYFTCSEPEVITSNIRSWYRLNPLINKVFVGIGNIDLLGWVANGVSAFFNFEIMPNVTLGGVGLIFLGVALFMFIIRIYKG